MFVHLQIWHLKITGQPGILKLLCTLTLYSNCYVDDSKNGKTSFQLWHTQATKHEKVFRTLQTMNILCDDSSIWLSPNQLQSKLNIYFRRYVLIARSCQACGLSPEWPEQNRFTNFTIGDLFTWSLIVRKVLFYTPILSLSLSHVSILELKAKYPKTESPDSKLFWVKWDYS